MGPVNYTEVRRRRERLKLSYEQAAKLIGWRGAQVWRNFEQGARKDPQVSTMARVAKVLKCKVDDLLTK